MNDKLEPLEAQDCVNEIKDYLLGREWYITDPVCNTQANALILDEIKKRYPPKNKTDAYKYRIKHHRCEYCQYNHYRHPPIWNDVIWQECELSNKAIKNYNAKFCKYYKVKE